MVYTFYFRNYVTGEILSCQRSTSSSATCALESFLRYLRRTDTIRSGHTYQVAQYVGAHSLDDRDKFDEMVTKCKLRIAR